jgi:pathogenesis-related protein 1
MTTRVWRFTTAVVVALAGVCAAIACAAPEGGLTRGQAEELVQAHNAWRRRVGVRPLRWSSELARAAQSHADRLAARGCRLEHGGLPRDTGQNLYGVGPFREDGRDHVVDLVPAQVVNAWGAEGAAYDHARNRCASGRKCGHYTQVVWGTTQQVGCGMAVCRSRGQVWVCNYQPAGNMEGKRPY